LPTEMLKQMTSGVVAPDEWGDYPHHYGKAKVIRRWLLEARRSYLSGDVPKAGYQLGVAFHYIQDAQTSFMWRSLNHEKGQEWHTKYEHWIEEAYISNYVEKLVKTAFSRDSGRMDYYQNFLKLLSSRIEGKDSTLSLAIFSSGNYSYVDSKWGNPAVDLNLAFQACLAIAKSVLGTKINVGIQEELSKMLKDCELRLGESEQNCSKKITELVRRRDRSKKTRGPLSFFSRIIMSKIFNRRAKSEFKKYQAKKHLLKIAKIHNGEVTSTVEPYLDWYEVTIPSLDINVIKKKLLAFPEH